MLYCTPVLIVPPAMEAMSDARDMAATCASHLKAQREGLAMSMASK